MALPVQCLIRGVVRLMRSNRLGVSRVACIRSQSRANEMSVNIDNHRWSRSAGSPSYFWLAFLGLFGVEDKPELTGEDRIIHMVKLAKLSQQVIFLAQAQYFDN